MKHWLFCTYNGWPEFINEIRMVKPRRNYVNRISSDEVWNVNGVYKNFCNRSIYIWSVSYMHITSNINSFGKRNTLEGRGSGKCQNFDWVMDALASWNCRLLLYSLVDVQTLKLVCLHNFEIFQQRTNFKFTTPCVFTLYVLVSEKYLRDLLSTCTACKLYVNAE
jgi:hypothetical protein